MGGRVDAEPPSPPSPTVRCVGRMVTGPSGEAERVGTGLGTTTLLRTTLAAGASTTTGGGALGVVGAALALAASTGLSTAWATLVTRVTRAGAASGASSGGADLAALFVAPVALTALVALAAFAAASGCTSRRSPSASARRRMRSA